MSISEGAKKKRARDTVRGTCYEIFPINNRLIAIDSLLPRDLYFGQTGNLESPLPCVVTWKCRSNSERRRENGEKKSGRM